MSGSFGNIWIHAVWATKYRNPILNKNWRKQLFQHIKEEAKHQGILLDFINGVEDHIHILFKLRTTETVSNIIKQIKGEASKWINEQQFFDDETLFRWQDGYGAISVSPDRITTVRNYIRKQEKHHQKKSYDDEIKLFKMYND
ncbi:MAG: IS200/IS605 family transposase [Saprospiraceae bacterium]